MDDDFDFAFEDELDALRELEEDSGASNPGNNSRKSLSFSTPAAKKASEKVLSSAQDGDTPKKGTPKRGASTAGLDESGLEPLEDSVTEENETSQKGKKRRKEQIFGSLSDSEDEDWPEEDLPTIVHRSKRARTNTSSANETPVQKLQAPSGVSDAHQEYVDRLTQDYDHDRVRVLRRIPDCAFIGVTGGLEGKRYYLKLKPDPADKPPIETQSPLDSVRLLGTPLAVLKAQMEEQVERRLEAQETRERETIAREEDKENDPQQQALWVEKYSPRQYTDLLSDESTNRTLLKWLKLWDRVVFGKEKKSKTKTAKDKALEEKQKKYKSKAPEVSDELDEHDRPLHKVVLLHGPPGLGKTTLGHIVARHCGYNVVEINASDDRSVEIFKTKIEAATQMKSVLGPDPRPNCLVIDEIDGSPQPAINLLISLIKGELGGNKKKKKQPTLLLRPIICICNDLYVPALRQLRSLALVMNFNPTLPSKLAGRLLEVARDQHMKADLATLMALCEKTDNDIRSCLNTMQFIRSQGKDISLRAVQSMSVGQKDAHKSLFSAWNQVFQLPRPQRKRYVNPYDRGTSVGEIEEMANMSNQNNTSMAARFQTILQVSYAAGDQEKMQQGLFENYLLAKVKDPRMDGLLYGVDWFCYVDLINKQIMQSQNYSIGGYPVYLPVAFHLIFSSNHPNRLQYPHSQFEFRTKHSKNQNLVWSMLEDMAPSVRKMVNQIIAVVDLVPNLMDIIAPTLRPVNTQLYSKREKEELKQLIKVMIAYNLTYQQQRNIEGQYTYALDPCVDEVVRFSGQKNQRQLTYAAKQLIAREIDLEKMRGSETSSSSEPGARAVTSGGKSGTNAKNEEKSATPNHLRQTLEPKAIKSQVDEKVNVDFFGRAVSQEDRPERKAKEKKKEVISSDIWFHFKVGFTNAVRKTVRVQDFL